MAWILIRDRDPNKNEGTGVADVLLKGTRERSERHRLLWMAPDVITFVITIPAYGQRLETIKFAISYGMFQGSHRSAASDH